MPWKIGDVEGHIKGLNQHQKELWVRVANDALRRCLADGRSQETCEGSAIRQANVVAKRATEAVTPEVLDDILGIVDALMEEREPKPTEVDMEGDFVQLVEKTVRKDGTVPIKVIQPGWGSSGYYSEEVLRQAAGVFGKGLKMFWNHPSATDELDRPERDINDLAAVFVRDAYFDGVGPAGPGLYADAEMVRPHYKDALEDLAPHIGVSILARGKAHQGEAEGRKGLIIDEILKAKSVDYVTEPGAGGKVLQLFEAVRTQVSQERSEQQMADDNELQELKDALAAKEAALATKETEVATLKGTAETTDQELARLREESLLRTARDVIDTALAETNMPDPTRERLVAILVKSPPMKDGELDVEGLKTKVVEAVKAETEYIQKVLGKGAVRGFGVTGEASGETLTEAFTALFKTQGNSKEDAEHLAELAITGR